MRQCGGPGRCAPPWTPSGPRRTRCGWCCGCCPTRSCWPGPRTGCSTTPSSRPSAGIRPPRGPASARWSTADAVLVDEASDLIERTPSLAHVVLDEAQDLSPMECRAIGRRCATGSATVLGDLAQSTAPAAAGSWPGLLAHLGKPGAEVRVLETGYRVPRQILDYANQLLGALAPGLAPARSLRQDPGALTVRQRPAGGAARRPGRRLRRRAGRARVHRRDRGRRPGAGAGPALGAAGVRHSVLDGSVDGLAGGGLVVVPGHPGQGPGVRPRHRGRAGPDRRRRGPRPAPALRRADPGRLPAHRSPHRAAPRAATWRGPPAATGP